MAIPDGYVVLVTGGASGIGRATALGLAAVGARVIAADRSADGLAEVAAAADSADGHELQTVELDVTDDAAVASVVNELVRRHGRIDALINCVGINPDAGTPSHEVDLDVFDTVYRVNLRSALVLSQAALRPMLSAGYGRIVHLASIAGKEGNPRMASYSATKAGLIGLVKALGREYATSGVTVNAVAPAVIRTPLVEAIAPEVVEGMLARIPMGRVGELSEIVALLRWAIDPEAGFTTGFTYDLSGGRATY